MTPTNLIQDLTHLTLNLVEQIQIVTYQQLEEFTEKRVEIVDQLLPLKEQLNDKNKEDIHFLGNFDELILNKMNSFRLEAGQWLTNRNQVKEQSSAYVGHTNYNSMFFDKKN